VNGFLVTIFFVTIEAVGDTTKDISETPLEQTPSPNILPNMTCTTLRAPRLRWFRAEVPKVPGMKGKQ